MVRQIRLTVGQSAIHSLFHTSIRIRQLEEENSDSSDSFTGNTTEYYVLQLFFSTKWELEDCNQLPDTNFSDILTDDNSGEYSSVFPITVVPRPTAKREKPQSRLFTNILTLYSNILLYTGTDQSDQPRCYAAIANQREKQKSIFLIMKIMKILEIEQNY